MCYSYEGKNTALCTSKQQKSDDRQRKVRSACVPGECVRASECGSVSAREA
jgi:hypothetical protein